MKQPTYKNELEKLANGYDLVIGCDEVGRGCLAGPVVAGAVALRPDDIRQKFRGQNWHKEIRDSKLLAPEKRASLQQAIVENCLAWGVGIVSHQLIDRLNIHHASLLAMRKAVNALQNKLAAINVDDASFIFVDGKFPIPGLAGQQAAVVNADEKILSVSAASIIAKVYRDSLMAKQHAMHPAYNFAQHKGYATKAHRQAIKKFGLSPIHRLSFCL